MAQQSNEELIWELISKVKKEAPPPEGAEHILELAGIGLVCLDRIAGALEKIASNITPR